MKQVQRILLALVMVSICFVIYQQKTEITIMDERITGTCRQVQIISKNIDKIYGTVYEKLDLSVLASCGIITDSMGHGSCVAISPNIILTAGHCLDKEGAWVEIGGIKYEIIDKWKSDKYDIGFVEIDGIVPYVIFGKMPELLQTVYKIGFPVQLEFKNFIATGIISNLDTDYYIWHNIIILDSPGIRGQSGCAVFNINGELVAIHVGHISYGFGVEEPVSHIQEALEDYDAKRIREKT